MGNFRETKDSNNNKVISNKMENSHKHHYLPVFYLKGFVNEKKNFFVFDKRYETIKMKFPTNTFFEIDRNTGIIGDEKSILLEEMYAHIENNIAPHFLKLKEIVNLNELDMESFFHSLRFIHFLYWRIPENDKILEEIINEQTFNESGFDLIDKETGKSSASLELQEQFKNVDLFRKMYRIFIPLLSSRKKYAKTDYENWKIYNRNDNRNFTGDNPVIIDKFIDFGSLNEELIFPLAGNKILVHTKRPKPESLPSIFKISFDMLLLQQANRYVCCSDKKYLENLVNDLYSYSKMKDWKGNMKEKLFSYFC